jgi:hypothetical protein
MSKKRRRHAIEIPATPAKPVDPRLLRAIAAVLRKLAGLLEAQV